MATDTKIQELTIAHSPDTDDAFMFYGLHKGAKLKLAVSKLIR
jgi:predicted solute-binding protein